MRCKACNVILDDTELTKKDANGDFIDMCNYCVHASGSVEVDSDTFVTNYQNELFTNDDDYGTLL